MNGLTQWENIFYILNPFLQFTILSSVQKVPIEIPGYGGGISSQK